MCFQYDFQFVCDVLTFFCRVVILRTTPVFACVVVVTCVAILTKGHRTRTRTLFQQENHPPRNRRDSVSRRKTSNTTTTVFVVLVFPAPPVHPDRVRRVQRPEPRLRPVLGAAAGSTLPLTTPPSSSRTYTRQRAATYSPVVRT